MTISTINNGETLSSVRSKLNANFSSLNGKTELVSAPASATASGVVGQVAIDTTYIYICTATNTWVRAPLAFVAWS
jgi:hypothetical protein